MDMVFSRVLEALLSYPLVWLGMAVLALLRLFIPGNPDRAETLFGRITRWLALVVLVVFLGGFGVCGAWGSFDGLTSILNPSSNGYGVLSLIPGLLGLGIAGSGAYALYRLNRQHVRNRGKGNRS